MTLAQLSLRPQRLPVILQTEAAECGLACIAMIAAWHGRRTDLAALRRRFAPSLKGATLRTLIETADRLELESRPLRLEIEHLNRLRLPCVLHWRFNHFVVLKSVGTRGLEIHDPAQGERRMSFDTVSEAFTGVALELWPGPAFRPLDERRAIRLRELTGPVTGLGRALMLILLLALALEVFAILSPLLMQWVIDHVLPGGNRDLLATLALGFALLVLLRQGTTTLRAWVIMHLGTLMSLQWQAGVFTRLLRLPVTWFERRHPGDTISRFRSIEQIRRSLTTSFIEAIADGVMTVITLVVIFWYSVPLSLICVGAVAIYALTRWLSFRPLRLASREQLVHAARQESHFLETVRGIRSVRLSSREPERRSHWLALLGEQVNAGLRAEKLQIGCRCAHGIVFGLENVAVIWLGATLVLDTQLTAGMLIAFVAYKNQFAERVAALTDRTVELSMLRVHADRLADIMLSDTETATERHPAGFAPASLRDATIRLEGVRFRYAAHEPWILDGIDLDIEGGETVAIVGPSGCGKSTLLSLMLGLNRPDAGRVLIGGIDISRHGPAAARQAIGSVLQDDLLFAGSIADNISFFAAESDRERVEHSAGLAGLAADIAALPMGYDTFVGHMGSVLSSGQKQRLLLARALYRRPRILLLDEATSHLDLERESAVNAALATLELTRVIVAHRPESIAGADRLVVLAGGRIVQTVRRGDARPRGAHADTGSAPSGCADVREQ
jgi:ATP-binding cassette, subfamily B, bacterial CvaB/MchF/RaxB